jgi:hypothetical protein
MCRAKSSVGAALRMGASPTEISSSKALVEVFKINQGRSEKPVDRR